MSGAKRTSRVLAALVFGAVLAAHADDGCTDFKWDVTKERALFATLPTVLAAGSDPKSAPTVVPNRLYRLKLAPQGEVSFAAPPARYGNGDVHAGLALLKIAANGNYRIALDLPLWVDVAVNGGLIPARDFQGQRTCNAPHKIVEFELKGARSFVLQLSSALSDSVLLTITPSPARVL